MNVDKTKQLFWRTISQVPRAGCKIMLTAETGSLKMKMRIQKHKLELARKIMKIIEVRERCIEKKVKKKLTSVSFMYVCVAENVELLVFFLLFFAPSP